MKAACDECGRRTNDLHPHPWAGSFPYLADAMRCEPCSEPSGDGSGYREPDVCR